MEHVSRRFTRVGTLIYKRLFILEVGRSIPENFNQKHIAENVFFSSMTELDRMMKQRDFYRANAELFIRYVQQVCEASMLEVNFSEGRLQRYIFESTDLLKLHSLYISKNGFAYNQWRTEYTEFFRLFRSSNQLINFKPVADSNLGIATLRMCIESRIRSAIGIIGIYLPKRHEVVKIPMSRLFRVMKECRNQIEIECDLDLIQRVYAWSNNFIHAGHANYSWLVPFAHDLLRPLFFYAPTNDGMSLYGNIRMTSETLKILRAKVIDPYLMQDKNAQIHGYREEDCFIELI